jgi:hypothetical protein
MTKQIGSLAAGKVVQRLTRAAAFDAAQIRSQNAAADLAERSEPMVYPTVNVYCEKIVNNMAEKFRRFSGTVQMAVEVRHSQDRLSGLQEALEASVDSVMQTLQTNRGDWSDGMYYAGGFQAVFTAVKHGGRNYLQTAKVTFEIGVSIS